jgi:dinuclear metal center YbgI/SA1388 family protein
MASLVELSTFLDGTLAIDAVPDYPNAVNGVQLANEGPIDHVATAVDFSSRTVAGAIAAGARLLLVHHGMFWGGVQPITGHRHRRIRDLIANDVAVYAAHLPLDVHPELGNNVLLARLLGLTPSGGFARYQTIEVGVSGTTDRPTLELADRAAQLAREHGGAAVVTPFDSGRVTRRFGICTGAGADSATIREAVARGIDTLIVGEGPHHTAVEASEVGLVIIYAGHYATETLGVRAVGDLLAQRFALRTSFIAAPSGL